ncbi:MAG: beta-lactamase family protein [Planctomycetes bacterium]|nr:beta-lactamase family protein [Planctomycetota bacterium]
MNRPTLSAVSLLACAIALPLRAQSCADLSDLTTLGAAAVSRGDFAGASIRIEQGGVLVREELFGSYALDELVPIASASKWLAAAVLMSCVDSGHLRLDDRVSTYLPGYTGAKSAITLAQCFSHSSGLRANHPAISDDSIDLQQAAQQIASSALIALPGTAFEYGGVSMHVAGAVCEIATGQSWAQLFAQRLAVPLGLVQTDFFAFGPTANPRIAGGARSTLREYARFVEMLRARGSYLGRRVLSEASVAAMFVDRTSALRVISTPHPAGAPYGIGTWLDRVSPRGEVLQVGGAGAFGFLAWIDLERDVAGTFSVLDRLNDVWPTVEEMKALTREELAPLGVTCLGRSAPSCAGAVHLHASAVPRPGATDFALRAHGAPASSAGVLLLAGAVEPVGLPLFGAELLLPPVPAPVALALVSTAAGNAEIPLPLPATLVAGERAAAQVLWFDPSSCVSGALLRSTPALAIELR